MVIHCPLHVHTMISKVPITLTNSNIMSLYTQFFSVLGLDELVGLRYDCFAVIYSFCFMHTFLPGCPVLLYRGIPL